MKTRFILSVVAFLSLTTLAIGQNNPSTTQQQNVAGKGIAYVDANNNSICDNYENRESNNFSGRRCGNMNGCGLGQRQRQGQGQGRGRKGGCLNQGNGSGKNYIDANKNGVCDNREIPVKK